MLAALDIPPGPSGADWKEFSIAQADDGAPATRPQYRHDYYCAFLLDPDGNSAEAVHHAALRAGDVIDHLWMRVSDVPAATRFYETIAPHAGLSLATSSDDHAWFRGSSGSFTLVAGEPTRHLQMVLPAADDETIDALHDAS